MRRFFKILKRELLNYFNKTINYFKYKFFISSFIYHYFTYMKIYKFVKSLDLNTLRYSYTFKEPVSLFSKDKTVYHIINEKYFISLYFGSSFVEQDIVINFDNEKIYLKTSLTWLGEEKLYDDILQIIKNIQFKEVIYLSGETIPDRVKLQRLNKIENILSE